MNYLADGRRMAHVSRRIAAFLAILVALSVGAGCRKGAAGDPTALPPLDVPVAKPLTREIIDYEEYTGRLMAVERVNVMARIDGYLTEVCFQPGQLVNKGDKLFVIDRRPMKNALDMAEAQLRQAEARVSRLNRDFQRMEQLMKSNAGTIEEFDKVQSDLIEAKAAVLTTKASVEQAKLNYDFTEVRAPISGRVGRANVTVGNLVQGSMPAQATVLTELVSTDQSHVYFDVPERDVLSYRRTMGIERESASPIGRLEVDIGLFDELGYPHKGKVDYMAERLDASTGTQTFRAVLPNPRQTLLTEGMFARVRVAFSTPYPGLAIAERAIATIQGQKCVYVVNNENTVEERAVEFGRIVAPGLRQVKAGLKADERVAVANLQRLMPGSKVAPTLVDMPLPPTR